MSVFEKISSMVSIREYLEEKGFEPESYGGTKYICPFGHDVNTASFSIYFDNDDREKFRCFGCKRHGDIVNLISDMENISMKSVIDRYCENYDPEREKKIVTLKIKKKVKKLKKKPIKNSTLTYEISGAHRDLRIIPFAQKSLQDDKARGRREYLYSRGMTKEVINDFRIGFTPPLKPFNPNRFRAINKNIVVEDSRCHTFFKKKFYTDDSSTLNTDSFNIKDLNYISLTRQGHAETDHYLPFRMHSYFIFPWYTIFQWHWEDSLRSAKLLEQGLYSEQRFRSGLIMERWITGDKEWSMGITGRREKFKGDKFRFFCEKNFSKGLYLYGINIALEHIKKEKSIILVEGEMDVLSLHSNGVKNAVAIGSSSVSHSLHGVDTQMDKLRILQDYGFIDNIYLLFDGDVAGSKAAKDVRDICEDVHYKMLNISEVKLPDGLDPNDFMMKHNKQELFNLEGF